MSTYNTHTHTVSIFVIIRSVLLRYLSTISKLNQISMQKVLAFPISQNYEFIDLDHSLLILILSANVSHVNSLLNTVEQDLAITENSRTLIILDCVN